MVIHCARARAQRRHKLAFNSRRISRFESFSRAEKVERLDVARIFLQSRFRELPGTPCPFAKLLNLARIDFGPFVFVSLVAVERRLQFPRFVELLNPQTGGETLRTRGMIRREVDHLLKAVACSFVVEVVERFITFCTQRVQLWRRLSNRSSNRSEGDEEEENARQRHDAFYQKNSRVFASAVTLK